MKKWLLLLLGTLVWPLGTATAQGMEPDWPEVQKLLENRCVICHGAALASQGLRLDSRERLLAGSSNGPVVIAGSPDESELLRRIRGESLPRMPLTGPPYLSDAETALILGWIRSLAPDAASVSRDPDPATPEPEAQALEDPGLFSRVAAVLVPRCATCHSPNGRMGPAPEGFVATSHASLLDARERAWIVPGDPRASELVRRIRGQSLPRMPFDGPPYLSAADIELIEEWIAAGAPNDQGQPAPLPVGARVRLGGTLSGHWQLDGLPLKVAAGTRIRENLRVGQRVEVRGWVESDGTIGVERIRAR
ncbi:c-type cytochrome domain-containing protein [Geoalkalibacter sp.]|uniref:c-type cytochrome domain-containing protein n=1 Tax=Geoalkalibacter sp. TaxID=3041440 RepID=UPI00272DDEA3|nr:c-type cytochrome domain-containing protein [Geoalkalibacter sp.]